MPHKNIAVELLQKLINDEIKSKFRTNVVKQRKFSELLKNALTKYQNRSIEAAQVIAELIEMANDFKKDLERADSRGLSKSEEAFYDALSNNKSAEDLMGEDALVNIAKEIADKLRKNTTIDWSVRDSVRAKIRLLIKTLLRKYKYPPDNSSAPSPFNTTLQSVVSLIYLEIK